MDANNVNKIPWGKKIVVEDEGYHLRGWFIAPDRLHPELGALWEINSYKYEVRASYDMYGEFHTYRWADYSDITVDDWEHPDWVRPEYLHVSSDTPWGTEVTASGLNLSSPLRIVGADPRNPSESAVVIDNDGQVLSVLFKTLKLAKPLTDEDVER